MEKVFDIKALRPLDPKEIVSSGLELYITSVLTQKRRHRNFGNVFSVFLTSLGQRYNQDFAFSSSRIIPFSSNANDSGFPIVNFFIL